MASILLLTVLPVVAFCIFAAYIAMRDNKNREENAYINAAYYAGYDDDVDIEKYKKALIKEASILKALYAKKKSSSDDSALYVYIASDEIMKKLRAVEKSVYNETGLLGDEEIIDIVVKLLADYKAIGLPFDELWTKIKSDTSELTYSAKKNMVKESLRHSYGSDEKDGATARDKRNIYRQQYLSSSSLPPDWLTDLTKKAGATNYTTADYFRWYQLMLKLTKKYDDVVSGGAKKKKKKTTKKKVAKKRTKSVKRR